jgi:hypothetical protein
MNFMEVGGLEPPQLPGDRPLCTRHGVESCDHSTKTIAVGEAWYLT